MIEDIKKSISNERIEATLKAIKKHFDKDLKMETIAKVAMYGYLIEAKEEDLEVFLKEQGWNKDNDLEFDDAFDIYVTSLFPELE